ncbi:nitronate monooxygenase [Haematobacter massiliensis]|uniref:Nitronate monooxygenase n=1 Tax=Haematobacter massiliensis TaxID=195105 RepID=A0A086Y715_9RHOB|nr:nitronate monooxygenase [Haematobacter massiliensis]KFI30065.1 2-nitropropane dioxygenase [Haematobacter massiliensis]OWJ70176.1 nitronate monooxygenase [Haematobacter massiliensis]OWJ88222.1 nitronate monooxygenase [Haematobacter massiliensis]QBJ25574.1 nitronate monooxygenase [Haematobacter massiliensis]
MTQTILNRIGITLPIFQAPMAGVSTPALAAAVSEAGGLGALGLGASSAAAVHQAISEARTLTERPFNANFFCHRPAPRTEAVEQAWIRSASPLFSDFGATPPSELEEIYISFRETDDFLRVVLDLRPAVVSFHFGLPRAHQIAAMRDAGLTLIASATSLSEARLIADAGFHAVIAQGWEAGGHRGIFEPDGPDERLSTRDLTRLLVQEAGLPVVAAGGLMEGGDIRRMLDLGAAAAQLGTAFIDCAESAADQPYRQRLAQGGKTVMTRVISGRPARCLANRFTDWGEAFPEADVPAYPRAYDLGKALNAAAKTRGETGYGAQWAGTGAGRGMKADAAEVMRALVAEV